MVNDIPAHRRETGMVFQNYALFPHLSVFDNIAYGLRARKIPRRGDRPAALPRSSRASSSKAWSDRAPSQLSGGQQQRVALARALVISPQILLMDEPLSNLDAKLRVSMREEIRRIQKRLGITTIYVTHDQEEAMAVSDRIAILNRGRVEQVGTPAEIYFRPASRFAAEFMGASNILEFDVAAYDEPSAHGSPSRRTGSGSSSRASKPAGRTVTVSVRPEWIRVVPAPAPGDRNVLDGNGPEQHLPGLHGALPRLRPGRTGA